MISTEVGGDNGSLADELRTNEPPELKVEGALTRTVKVGQSRSRWWRLPVIPTTCRRAGTASRSPG